MFLRVFITVIFLILCASITGTFTLKSAHPENFFNFFPKGSRPILNLAPLSLGNPEAARNPLVTIAPTSPIQKSQKQFSRVIQQVYKAKKGDTVEKILARAGVKPADARKAISTLKQHYNPKTFRLGQKITIYLRIENANTETKQSSLGTLLGLRLYPSLNSSIKVIRSEKGQFSSYKEARNLKTALKLTRNAVSI